MRLPGQLRFDQQVSYYDEHFDKQHDEHNLDFDEHNLDFDDAYVPTERRLLLRR